MHVRLPSIGSEYGPTPSPLKIRISEPMASHLSKTLHLVQLGSWLFSLINDNNLKIAIFRDR